MKMWGTRFVILALLLTALTGRLEAGNRHILRQTATYESKIHADKQAEFINSLESAVKSHQPAELQSFIETGLKPDLSWLQSPKYKWNVEFLELKAEAGVLKPIPYIVFSAWHSLESGGDHIYRLLETDQGYKLGSELPESDPAGLRIRDHDLNVVLDVPDHIAKITDNFAIERMDGNASEYGLFRISPDFHILSLAQLSETGKAVSSLAFKQAGGVVEFACPADKKFKLTASYSGIVNHEDGDYIMRDEAMLFSYWYPHTARLPATATVSETVPSEWKVVGQGEQTEWKQNKDGTNTYSFRNKLPVSFFSLDAGKFIITTRIVFGVKLSVYQLKKDDALAGRSLDTLQRAFAFYTTHFGPYPYTHYDLVETLGPFENALEAYSFATFGSGTLHEDIAHELAHTWWGGIIPCTYTRSMWNEAFANYSDSLMLRMTGKPSELKRPTSALLKKLRENLKTAFSSKSIMQASDTEDQHDIAIGYDKGEMVLRALEEELGQKMMLNCLKAFLAGHINGEAAEWSDFEKAVKQASGSDYKWFFDQWLRRAGTPMAKLASLKYTRSGSAYSVEGDFVQTGEIYRMRVPLTVEMSNGITISKIVLSEKGATHFQISCSEMPLRVRVDPENILPLTFPDDTPKNSDPLIGIFR